MIENKRHIMICPKAHHFDVFAIIWLFSSFALFFSSKMSTFPLPLQDMPKCADVRLQLGSENLLQDIRDVAFLRKLQRLGSYTFGKALNNAMKQGRGQGSTLGSARLRSWPDRWRPTSEGTGIQSSMFGSWWALRPKLGGERFPAGTKF